MAVKLRTIAHKLAPSHRVKVKVSGKRADSFYLSREWRALIDGIIRQRGRRCEDPEHESGERFAERLFGDHIRERKDGGAPLDPANVMLRCGSCHTRKTAKERAKRYHGGGGSNL
jgi:5-methylcytosine-specific restriction protein A